jgi:hypothetical protein
MTWGIIPRLHHGSLIRDLGANKSAYVPTIVLRLTSPAVHQADRPDSAEGSAPSNDERHTTAGQQSPRIMAGYPIHRRRPPRRRCSWRAMATRRLPPLVRRPPCDSDGFMNMSNASTSGRQPLAWTLAATESEHPPSATTRHSAHNAEYLRLAAIRDWRRVAHISAGSGSRRGPAGLLGQWRGHLPAVRAWLTFMTRPHCARYRPRSGRRPAGRGRGRRRRRAAACASPADEP